MKRMLCPGCVEHHGYMCSWMDFQVPDGKCPHCGSTVVDEDELEDDQLS